MAGIRSPVLAIALLEPQEENWAETEDTRRGDGGGEQETHRNDFSHISTARGGLGARAEYSHLGRQWTTATSAVPIGRTMPSPSLTCPVTAPAGLLQPGTSPEMLRNVQKSRKSQSRPSRAGDYPCSVRGSTLADPRRSLSAPGPSIGCLLSLSLLPRESLTLSLVASLFAKPVCHLRPWSSPLLSQT